MMQSFVKRSFEVIALPILLLATIVMSSYIIHKSITNFDILPRVQGDMGGFAFQWIEKLNLNVVFHYYSPTKSSPYVNCLNHPFLTIIPSLIMRVLETNNVYEGIFIVYTETLVLAFLSAYILVYYITKNPRLGIASALLYMLSPLFLGITFIPNLKIAYALLPLLLVPFVSLFIDHSVNTLNIIRLSLILVFSTILIAWSHIETFILVLAVVLPITIVISLQALRRKAFIRVLLSLFFLVITLTIGFIVFNLLNYNLAPTYLNKFLIQRKSINVHPYTSRFTLIDYVGFSDYDSIAFLIWINNIQHNPFKMYLDTYRIYTIIFTFIVWIPILICLLSSNRERSERGFIALTLLFMSISYAVFKLWPGLRLYILMNYEELTIPVINIIKDIIIVIRTPARFNAVVFPLMLLSWALSMNSLKLSYISKIKRFNLHLFKRISFVVMLLFMILIAICLNFVPGTYIYVYHTKLREDIYGHEWTWSTVEKIVSQINSANEGEHYHSRILDLSALQPHYFFLGQRNLDIDYRADFDLVHFYKSPSWRRLLYEFGVGNIVITNYTKYWWFVGRDISEVIDNRFAKLYRYKDISIYSTYLGKALLWIKVPRIPAMSTITLIVRQDCKAVNVTYIPLYSPRNHSFIMQLPSDLVEQIISGQRMTIEAWVKLHGLSHKRDQWIISSKKNSWDNNGFALFYGFGSDLHFNIGNWSYQVSYNVKSWWRIHHVVAVYDQGELKLYIDDLLVAHKYVNRPIIPNTSSIFIGGRDDDFYKLDGTILDLRIYPEVWEPVNLNVREIFYGNYTLIKIRNPSKKGLVNYWIKVEVPVQDSCKAFTIYSPNNPNLKLTYFIDEIISPMNHIKWAELRIPIILIGGANILSILKDIDYNNIFVPIFYSQLNNKILTKNNSIPILISNGDSLYLWLITHKNNYGDASVIELYKTIGFSEAVRMVGFNNINEYNSPFLDFIPADIYGSPQIAPWSLRIGEQIHSFTSSFTLGITESKNYAVLLRMSVEGIGRAKICLSFNDKILCKDIVIYDGIPRAGWLLVGFVPLEEGVYNVDLSVTKDKSMTIFLDAVIIMPKDLYEHVLTDYYLNQHSNVFGIIRSFIPLPLTASVSGKINMYKGSGTLLNVRAGALILKSISKIEIPFYMPFNTSTAGDILLHIVKAFNAKIVISIYQHDYKRVFTYELNDVTSPTWLNIASLNMSRGTYRLKIEVLKGYVIIDAFIFLSKDFINLLQTNRQSLGTANIIDSDLINGKYIVLIKINNSLNVPRVLFLREPYYTLNAMILSESTKVKLKVLPAYVLLSAIPLLQSQRMLLLEVYHETQNQHLLAMLNLVLLLVVIITLLTMRTSLSGAKR